jgi:hypothetical protein
MVQRVADRAFEVRRDFGNHPEDDLADALGVLVEHLHYLFRRDGLDLAFRHQPAIVVGNQRDVHDGNRQLQCEVRFGVLRHVDDFPAHRGEPLALGFGGEAGSVDDDNRAALVDGNAVGANLLDGDLAQHGAIRVSRRDMMHGGTLIESVGAPVRAVDILVGDNKVAWLDMGLQAACGTGADDCLHAEFLHRPYIRTVVDFVWRDGVLAPVSREEGYAPPVHLANRDEVAGWTVGRINFHLLHFVQK